MAGRIVRWGAVLGAGALWWWAAVRLALVPGAGAVEGVAVAGGWGLSLLPVHCAPQGRAQGALAAGRWRRAWRGGRSGRGRIREGGAEGGSRAGRAGDLSRSDGAGGGSVPGPVGGATTASSRRRSGAGSDPS
ncbi:hypothetical protein V5O46_26435 [Streptomyces sp. C6-003]